MDTKEVLNREGIFALPSGKEGLQKVSLRETADDTANHKQGVLENTWGE